MMKQFCKRAVAMVMTVCMLLGLLCTTAWAAGSSFDSATRISTDTWYSDNLTTSSEQDYFRFTLPKDGYITLSFKHDYVDMDGAPWQVKIYAADCEYNIPVGEYTAKTKASIDSMKIGLPQGAYYIKVGHGTWCGSTCWSDRSYSLKINYTDSTAWETEDNNTFTVADLIKGNKIYNGALVNNSDVDYYCFVLKEQGYISLSFKHEYADMDGAPWQVELYNADCDYITSLGGYTARTKATIDSMKIGLPQGAYYIKVGHGTWCGSTCWSDKSYSLKVNYTASLAWEMEFNNSFDTSNSIKINSPVSGSKMAEKDVDYYKIKLSKTQTLKLLFKHAYCNDDYNRWYIDFYDKNYESIDLGYAVSGHTTSFTESGIKLKAGTYYIKVNNRGTYSSDWSSIPYTMELRSYVPAPTISGVKNTNSGIKISWNAVSGADGYKVYRKAGSGDWECIKTINDGSTASLTNTKVTNGTKYQYKVLAFKSVDGKTVNSSYSKVKTMYRLTRPTISSAKNSAAKKITVKWKENAKATGYQIKYVVGDTTKTVKVKGSDSLSKVLSSLTKGKTYKVSVRAYKTVSGTTYYSAYSATRSVKVTK